MLQFASLLFFVEPLHVHFDTTLHARLLDVRERDETLRCWCLARGVFHKLLQANLLVWVDVLLVVFDSVNPLESALVVLA